MYKSSVLLLVSSILINIGVWAWAKRVLIPAYSASAVTRNWPMGNNSDLYPVWLTAREVLLHRKQPYSAQLTDEIQEGVYGRKIMPGHEGEPGNAQAFVYPLYVILLFSPLVGVSFPLAMMICRWLFLVCIGLSVYLWQAAVRWRPSWLVNLSVVLLTLGNFPAIMEYVQQNISALAIFFLAVAAAASAREHFVTSGVFLALSTVKPQLSALLIAWLLFWAANRWSKRNRLILSFVVCWTLLVLVSVLISPHWIGGFISSVRAYRGYALSPPIFELFLPRILALLVNLTLVVLSILVCWPMRSAEPGGASFGWSIAVIASLTLVILPKQDPHYQFLLVPAVLALVASSKSIFAAGAIPRMFAKGTFACLLWHGFVAAILGFASFLINPTKFQVISQLPLATLYATPPLLIFATLSAALSLRRTTTPKA